MRRIIAASLFWLFFILSFHAGAFAEERVLRLRSYGQPNNRTLLEYQEVVVSTNAEHDVATFVVYTKEEINSQIAAIVAVNAQDAKTIAELREMIARLNKNMKDLADLNDALTKRLEGLEKKCAGSQ